MRAGIRCRQEVVLVYVTPGAQALAQVCLRLSLPKRAFSPIRAQMYEIFGKYGAIRQIRVGSTKETRGTAYVVYEDIYDAKNAADHLSGFNVQVRLGLMQG